MQLEYSITVKSNSLYADMSKSKIMVINYTAVKDFSPFGIAT